MYSIFRSPVLSILFTICMICSGAVKAADSSRVEMVDQSANLFQFQQKLAKKGNAVAQYRLGFMYERGIGVKADEKQATNWYQQSALKGNTDAAHRLTYLQVQKTGFKAEQHNEWLAKVKSEARMNQSESMFLLAQLYGSGIGVKKNLTKSLDMLYQLSAEGIVTAEVEIKSLESQRKAKITQARYKKKAKLYTARKKQNPANNKAKTTVVATAKPLKVVTEQPASTATARSAGLSPELNSAAVKTLPGTAEKTIKPAKKSAIKPEIVAQTGAGASENKAAEDSVLAAKEEKRKRYEAIMKKLAEEQAQIDGMQKWADGDHVASVEDEL